MSLKHHVCVRDCIVNRNRKQWINSFALCKQWCRLQMAYNNSSFWPLYQWTIYESLLFSPSRTFKKYRFNSTETAPKMSSIFHIMIKNKSRSHQPTSSPQRPLQCVAPSQRPLQCVGVLRSWFYRISATSRSFFSIFLIETVSLISYKWRWNLLHRKLRFSSYRYSDNLLIIYSNKTWSTLSTGLCYARERSLNLNLSFELTFF